MSSTKVSVSVVILTYNEEINLRKYLGGLVEWATEVFVLDSRSADKTQKIAEQFLMEYSKYIENKC